MVIAKQSLKGASKEIPANARQAFFQLRMLGIGSTWADWNKILGMRNALVHDYLNFDPDRLLDVIKNKQNQALLNFSEARFAG